jgi:acetylornithine deacetylase/succinyl-diaminopimelate desuccinylase-like protein
MITEGDEETGSGHVEEWVKKLKAEGKLGNPKMVFCLDSGGLDYQRFFLTNSLRGYCSIEFEIEVLKDAIHSGSGSGIIPTCHRIIRELINRIERSDTGEMPLFDVEIPSVRLEEIAKLITTFKEKSIK